MDEIGSMMEPNFDKKFSTIVQNIWIADFVEFNTKIQPRDLKIASSFVGNSTSIQYIYSEG